MSQRPIAIIPETATPGELRTFAGHPGQFWPAFLGLACREAGAGAGSLLIGKPSGWRMMFRWLSDAGQPDHFREPQPATLARLAESSLRQGCAWAPLESADGAVAMALPLADADPEHPMVLLLFLDDGGAARIEEIGRRLQLLTDIPAAYRRERQARRAQKDLATFADILDLQLLMNLHPRFLASAMTLVNEAAPRYRCARVSIGWVEGGNVRLQAVSHVERFERKTDLVADLEAAMEESFDQDVEILLPPEEPTEAITRAHDHYAREQRVGHLLSLPMRSAERTVGILTCERSEEPFTEDDVLALRILCDQVAARLHELKLNERWPGSRLKDRLEGRFADLLGVEHTILKLAGLTFFFLLLLSLIIRLPYRIEAPFLLRSEDVRQVSAPFDGFIGDIHIRIGQHVDAGQPLLSLDSSDLQLEEAAALANQSRYQREVEKARAFGTPNEMRIAEAQAEQARAQLELVRQRLALAELRAPIAGVVVEGDLAQLRGAPVEKGAILFKIARHEHLYVELKVDERDVHELAVGQHGKLAFVSQPDEKFPFRIDEIDPIARVEPDGNIFMARARDLPEIREWWRPGMSGIAKVETGWRTLLWIVTHRTIDFFQMRIWW